VTIEIEDECGGIIEVTTSFVHSRTGAGRTVLVSAWVSRLRDKRFKHTAVFAVESASCRKPYRCAGVSSRSTIRASSPLENRAWSRRYQAATPDNRWLHPFAVPLGAAGPVLRVRGVGSGCSRK
jgi:hypothetical protein